MPKKHTLQDFLSKSKQIHGNKYNYSKVNYINAHTKVKIICSEHGEFWQDPHSHYKGHGCPKCYKRLGRKFYNNEIFKQNAQKIHENKYDYSKVNYVNAHTKVKIICLKHGEFWQRPYAHLQGHGCPSCSKYSNKSKREIEIENLLIENNITYSYQKNLGNNLPFDFYLNDLNLTIEHDGIQHFRPIKFFGGEEYFKELKRNDSIKNKFCEENKIKLIRIAYNENIKEKLSFLF